MFTIIYHKMCDIFNLMAYSELIKDFNRIRSYIRSFYVYGFLHRNEYEQKSARSYDNERRRVESWLGEYMTFGHDSEGRRFFISVDSRAITHNPLYRAFRTKSFTDKEIMLHFQILDILSDDEEHSLNDIIDELIERLSEYDNYRPPDESTVRKKLAEYVLLGLIERVKKENEKSICYMLRNDEIDLESWESSAEFFSGVSPLGVIGSFVHERFIKRPAVFHFKHHYILDALDSEILYGIFSGITEKRIITIKSNRPDTKVIPLKIYVGTQTGRQYLLGMSCETKKFCFYRLDLISSIELNEQTDKKIPEESISEFTSHVWGVSTGIDDTLTRIRMTVLVEEGEEHIIQRLEREKRCGTVERLDDSHYVFSAEVFDAIEMLPFIRTFIGRITSLECTDERVIERFRNDMKSLCEMYDDAVQ